MKNQRMFNWIALAITASFMMAGCFNTRQTNQSSKQSQEVSSSIDDGTTKVKGIYLNYETARINVGKTFKLKYSLEPENATNQNVTWNSSDESIATVNNGLVTGVSAGQASITVLTEDGNHTATCLFTIEPEEEKVEPEIPDAEDILKITEAGEYTLEQDYKQIYVNAPDDAEVVINMNGHTVQSSENSPIYVYNCDSIEIAATKKTTSYIKDMRNKYTTDIAGQGKGAIYVENGDLKLKATGTLNIEANYLNGIHGKDDVTIQKLTLNVTAVNHGIRGNDSITIKSGNVNISCGGDGLHTENSDISSKGNQRGNVTISGGTLDINSWGDAVAASYNAIIEEADPDIPTSLTAKTNKYSSYSGDVIDTQENVLYLKLDSRTYSNGKYTYAAYIGEEWCAATYKGTKTYNQGGPGGQGASTYYIYQINKPNEATSFTLYRFEGQNVTDFSLENYNAKSDVKAFNNAYDMVSISIRDGKISFNNWSNYNEKSTNGADISAKGIKAENEIYITAGTININAYDDAIHANNDGTLENGDSPLGNINISGGEIVLAASDDAIHADNELNVSSGSLTINESYEGLEGNVINISGGNSFVFATDDGVNATSGNAKPSVNISGGLLDVTVPTSGDTDGIDSNGTLNLTGGVAIVKGPGSANRTGSPSAAIDTEGEVTLSEGTLIVFGGIERTPTTSLTKTLCSSSSVKAGNHTISFSEQSYTTNLRYATNGCIVYSSLGSATLD